MSIDGMRKKRDSLTLAERVRRVWDTLTGSESSMTALYRSAFADMNHVRYIADTKRQNSKLLLICIAGGLAVSLLGVYSLLAASPAADLSREGPGGSSRSIPLTVTAEYGESRLKENVALRVMPETMGAEEAEAALDELAERLPIEILAGNSGLTDIRSDLFLPGTDSETGADITWRSSDESIVSAATGRVNTIGIDRGTRVTLEVYLRLDEAYLDSEIELLTGLPLGEGDTTALLKQRVDEAVAVASGDEDGGELNLPSEWKGVTLSWDTEKKSEVLPVLLVTLAAAFLVYKCRFRRLEKRISGARESMGRDFPDFLGKLSLLIGAGLTVTSAIERMIEGYERGRRGVRKQVLYEELIIVRDRLHAAGTSLTAELADMAMRSGLRELLRFSSILSDNIDKGSVLVEKLETERELMWESRKKDAEKRIRLAETKLIFPMVLQLAVIIAITVMPTALEM